VNGGHVRKTSTLQEVRDALFSRLAKAELDLNRHRSEHQTEEGMQDRVNQRLAARITALEEAVRKIS
jgi:DNA replication initiation complex subunit (GINS family)